MPCGRTSARVQTACLRWLVAGTISTSAGCGGEHSPEAGDTETAIRVVTDTVRLVQVPVVIGTVGTTEPYARATLATRLLGRVQEVRVHEGQRVAAGAVLVRIEGGDLDARQRQAASALQEAQAVLANASSHLRRTRNLYEQRAVPKQRLDEAETDHQRAEATVATARGALQEVDAILGDATVRAPFAGVVVHKFVQVGDMASPGTPLCTMEQQERMKVTVEVAEQDLPFVHLQSAVQVEVEALATTHPGSWIGNVETLVPAADPTSRTFQARVVVDNSDGVLRSGMFARVGFEKGERPGLLVAETAILRRGQLEGVFVVQDGRARLRWVRLGKAFGSQREVIAGLEAGDVIAVSGIEVLHDGVPVEVGTDG